jgi:DNA mismatch repair protein MutS
MVEMTETANILHHATSNSLVLMDEIGRGTSTFDGLSLAFACADYLATQLRAFTLFSTHYFEITALADERPCVHNIHLEVADTGKEIIFLHTVKEGPAHNSYGLHVAALAGIPRLVIAKATKKLSELSTLNTSKLKSMPHQLKQASLFDPKPHPAVNRIKEIKPDTLSPREALEALYELAELASIEEYH